MDLGEPLPAEDRVTRGARGRGVHNGVVTFSAFDLRKHERELKRISVDWVECKYAPAEKRNLEGSAARLAEVVEPPYAVLEVKEIRSLALRFHKPDVREAKSQRNHCHGAIVGFLADDERDMELKQRLAEIANKNPILISTGGAGA
jgi:hypothetical protein